jgi:hypothetical protein
MANRAKSKNVSNSFTWDQVELLARLLGDFQRRPENAALCRNTTFRQLHAKVLRMRARARTHADAACVPLRQVEPPAESA